MEEPEGKREFETTVRVRADFTMVMPAGKYDNTFDAVVDHAAREAKTYVQARLGASVTFHEEPEALEIRGVWRKAEG